jgi:tRNA threonylcarbamoyladenosine biosynthesis protein TsaB
LTRVLALDTSTWWGSVALVECAAPGSLPRTVAEHGEKVSGSHVEYVIAWIEHVLAAAGWSRSSLDAFAATRGPGSFTGIRVGLGLVRGMSLASGRPCTGVTTLQAIAEACGPGGSERVPVLDAGRGQVYSARYDAGSSPPRELEPPALDAAAELLRRVSRTGARLLLGPGTDLELPGDAAGPQPSSAPWLLAGAVGRLAVLSGFQPGEVLAPLYIRRPDVRERQPRG